MSSKPSHPPLTVAGQALPEFLLAGLLTLLLGSALYEGLQWQRQREILYLALAEAARAGSRSHIDPQAIAQSFTRALRPLMGVSPGPDLPGGLLRWRIEVLQPGPAHYRRHGKTLPGLPAPAIQQDYQAAQHARQPGPPSIFEANTLRLRLTYASAPATLWIRAVLPGLARWATDTCQRSLLAAGWLPQRLELAIDMQSHALRWPPIAGVHTRSRPCDAH